MLYAIFPALGAPDFLQTKNVDCLLVGSPHLGPFQTFTFPDSKKSSPPLTQAFDISLWSGDNRGGNRPGRATRTQQPKREGTGVKKRESS